jgi:hypothetical protein
MDIFAGVLGIFIAVEVFDVVEKRGHINLLVVVIS